MRRFLASLPLLLTAAVFSATGPGSPPEVIGGGKPVTMENLPPGPVRERLKQLSPAARARALTWLAGLTLPVNDQETLRVDDNGAIWVSDDGLVVRREELTPSPESPDILTPANCTGIAADGVPICHSKTGSTRRLYLDFNGATVAGKAWGATTWAALPYDTSGDRTVFTPVEQDAMRRIWARIAEDYFPWDIDVTTQQPADFSESTNPSNLAWLLITRNTDAAGVPMPSSGAGGVAYVNVFGQANYYYYQPAFIYDGNGGGREDILAEAGSHEIGHNMGLNHDGCVASCGGYYGGHGSGETSWGPLMGTGYNRNVSQWAMGGYPDANNTTQDDLAVIAAKLTYRPDDCGATNATACAATAGASAFSGAGTIEQTTDVDAWSFTMPAGTLSLTVQRYYSPANTRGNNVDLIAELYNSGGGLLASNAPTANPAAAITGLVLGAGTYYLKVRPDGDTTSPYPLYGSVGQYSVSGSWAATPLPGAVPANSLRVYKSGSNLVLNWSAACSGIATDYAIYQGTMGSWSGHASLSCTTGGALGRTVTPGSGNRYYLVTPTAYGYEGSYGRTSSGAEIPPAAAACAPQSLGGCS